MRKLLGGLLWIAAASCVAQPRPQLDDAAAARHRIADYLAQGDEPWRPAALRDSTAWRADFIVAADGSGTHRTLQAAIDAVPVRSATGARRYRIQLQPGTYREVVCAQDKAPFTLVGNAADPAAVVIVANHYNGEAKRAGVDAANPCLPALAASSFGTPGSASVAIFSDDVQLAHLTVANDSMAGVRDGVGYPPGAGESGGAQGVALMTQGDRIQLADVQLRGHQDTFYVRRATLGAGARVLVQDSRISGDVDFIFGNATLVIDGSTIVSRTGRRAPGQGGHVLAPSTDAEVKLGLLVVNSRLVGEPGLKDGAISLGRAWDSGVAAGAYQAGVSPNGQALIRDSVLGAHLGPWAASTSRRPFSASGADTNRLFEYRNTALGKVEVAREALAPNDGWAAAEGSTRGGSDAALADVFEVRNRAELVAALSSSPRPRIVQLRGRIDLSVDDAGRPLGYDDYRDPAFDFEAFVRAYDSAIWGKKAPEGPLEEARQRSARRQAERVLIRVPANTSLIGLGSDAALVHGTLLIDKVDNVIVRNIHFSDAYDYFPAWDPKDNADGEWNSEYDNITLRGATHVWIDHCTFDDGDRPDQAERVALGRRMQHHDGLLDITAQSNFVTVSWNHFHDHDKTTLVGSGDGQKADDGKLKVSFHHNLWERVKERTPRVRYGEVHVYNNLYVGRSDVPYAFGYSIGIGVQSRVYSERNVWDTSPAIAPGQLTRWWKGTSFFDTGSLHNGQPVDLLGALRTARPEAQVTDEVGWRPRFFMPLDPVDQVAAKVRAGAGAGRL
ncbi:MAG: hypothetical protein HY021_14030 [Burkholderiales bacterium]|nr:hypothetical protein [Burkholderiales bacterium]